ncbi:hypothetical protein NPIL_223991 [Nephila pilipes]|uniref:Uncharacterized protein n=1 Tax=Nephila pilipes TaxID=299642 RepID=A0A8X6PLX2_NEPPI|nr:hypothetical protein NPIL_223991 [Nephila pilipes]
MGQSGPRQFALLIGPTSITFSNYTQIEFIDNPKVRLISTCLPRCHFMEGNFNPTFFISGCGWRKGVGEICLVSPSLPSDDDIKVIINNAGSRMSAINPHRPLRGCTTGF